MQVIGSSGNGSAQVHSREEHCEGIFEDGNANENYCKTQTARACCDAKMWREELVMKPMRRLAEVRSNDFNLG